MPVRDGKDRVLCDHRDLQRMCRADAARGLIAIGNTIELKPDLAFSHALNRNFDVTKAESGIVARTVRIKIERADRAMRACAELAVARHLRIRPGRCSRRQQPKRTELPVGIALTQNSLPFFSAHTGALASRPSRPLALSANVSRAIPSACSANSAGRSCLMVNG